LSLSQDLTPLLAATLEVVELPAVDRTQNGCSARGERMTGDHITQADGLVREIQAVWIRPH
jgi:hypothetical protein